MKELRIKLKRSEKFDVDCHPTDRWEIPLIDKLRNNVFIKLCIELWHIHIPTRLFYPSTVLSTCGFTHLFARDFVNICINHLEKTNISIAHQPSISCFFFVGNFHPIPNLYIGTYNSRSNICTLFAFVHFPINWCESEILWIYRWCIPAANA